MVECHESLFHWCDATAYARLSLIFMFESSSFNGNSDSHSMMVAQISTDIAHNSALLPRLRPFASYHDYCRSIGVYRRTPFPIRAAPFDFSHFSWANHIKSKVRLQCHSTDKIIDLIIQFFRIHDSAVQSWCADDEKSKQLRWNRFRSVWKIIPNNNKKNHVLSFHSHSLPSPQRHAARYRVPLIMQLWSNECDASGFVISVRRTSFSLVHTFCTSFRNFHSWVESLSLSVLRPELTANQIQYFFFSLGWSTKRTALDKTQNKHFLFDCFLVGCAPTHSFVFVHGSRRSSSSRRWWATDARHHFTARQRFSHRTSVVMRPAKVLRESTSARLHFEERSEKG